MTIHNSHPFAPADADRSPVRRLRGRLPSPVTIWTTERAGDRAGLTVSSVLVVDGEPGAVIGVLDPLSELWELLTKTGIAAVNVLAWPDHQLAEAFGFVAPSPGGPFRLGEWTDSDWGPTLDGAAAWAGCRLSDRPPAEVGWGLQVQLDIEHIETRGESSPLIHHRGRYHTI